MAALLAEGIWAATAVSATFGENDRGAPSVQINVRIDEGPSAGRQCTYSDEVNTRSALYIGRSCRAVGWKGVDLDTLKADVAAWVKATGGKTSAEVKHIEVKRGKRYDEWVDGGQIGPAPLWDKVNSIGRGAKPLVAATPERKADANEAMRAAMSADGGTPPADDARHAATGSEDDIPFLTCSTVGLGEIAKVLR